MTSLEPQVTNCRFVRKTLAINQPQYQPLQVAAVIETKEGVPLDCGPVMVSRLELTAEELQVILEGGDIYIAQLTFGKAYRPLSVTVVPKDVHLDCGGF